jgi:spore coat polysaccharide biosynthesis protein SpsF
VAGGMLLRLKKVKNADNVILSTSTDDRDTVLVDIANKNRIDSFQGSKNDKLKRYRDTAHRYNLDFLVIIDGDDPFVSVEHIEKIINYAKANKVDYVQFDGLPLGATGFGVSAIALNKMCVEKTKKNTEVWQYLFIDNPNYMSRSLKDSRSWCNRPDIRMTLDYKEDYDFFLAIEKELSYEGRDCSFKNIMQLVEKNPHLAEINKSVMDKYKIHFENSM